MQAAKRRSYAGGSAIILSIGALMLGLSASVMAIDLPYYFATQNQLQTAVDAAALAGATALPTGEAEASEAALELAAENPVGGQALSESNLNFSVDKSKFKVTGEVYIPTIMGKLLCALSGNGGGKELEGEQVEGGNAGNSGEASCNAMKVVAGSSAAPAARDTILVIDTSNSMDDLGNNRPMKDIKTAANKFISIIAALDNESVDRIGLVSFDQTGAKEIGLTSANQSPSFTAVKNKVNGLSLFSGVGWNTNYEPGLKLALDELQSKGRKNASKIIIFMTDGIPNLPAPDSYYSYNYREPYRKCIDPVNNSQVVRNLCYTRNGQKICPVLPNDAIKNSMIPASAVQCTNTYVDAMESKTNLQTERAKTMGVTIHTISLYDPYLSGNSQDIFRRLLKQPTWRPEQLDFMAQRTEGQQYEAANYDSNRIQEIYETVAQDIHVRLTN
ncbi:vWA domain-containing protein [Vampirovibrio sp.]|uniref:vWA domain-containing protein n=1 Tax=Vampirovibrio sp. TaxID=2717857 RepID=UPI0035939870